MFLESPTISEVAVYYYMKRRLKFLFQTPNPSSRHPTLSNSPRFMLKFISEFIVTAAFDHCGLF